MKHRKPRMLPKAARPPNKCRDISKVKPWKAKRVKTRAAAKRAERIARHNAANAAATTDALQRIAAALTPLRGTTASAKASQLHERVILKTKSSLNQDENTCSLDYPSDSVVPDMA